MASRLFGYNSSAPVSGAVQSGNLAVSNDFRAGGAVQWWNGPNEDLGYVIGYPDTTGLRKANGSLIGGNAVGFVRTSTKTDVEFLSLANSITGQGFASASIARDWLNTNGYYTSYPFIPQQAVITGATVSGSVLTSNSAPSGIASSYQLNGSTGYISYPASTDFALGTGDFTIEWFQYQTSQPSNPRVFQIGNYFSTIAIGCSIEGNSSSAIFYLWLPGANSIKTFNAGAHLNTWIHFAIVRISGSIKVYQNGVQIGSTISNSASLGNSTQTLSIGQESTATANSYFPGYITQFRWTKGLGIYTGTFSVPNGPLTTTSSANPFGGSNTSAIGAGFVKFIL